MVLAVIGASAESSARRTLSAVPFRFSAGKLAEVPPIQWNVPSAETAQTTVLEPFPFVPLMRLVLRAPEAVFAARFSTVDPDASALVVRAAKVCSEAAPYIVEPPAVTEPVTV